MQSQIPFTGGSGELLDQAFRLAKVRKEQLFITNVVHCHPPGNRRSQQLEIENCTEYLRRELAIVQPKLVISLGKDAENWLRRQASKPLLLWSGDLSLSELTEVAYLFVYHPASFLYRPAKQKEMEYVELLARAIRWAFHS